ncbi:hypothetical protein ACJMK2_014444 [Sinanodonta woodiana]|uniref:Uncharacterized protein n=1 Tax=Sinanodonta woodiana TaxID=1069815 RepID=A0ABD3V0Q5_SINWO
MFWISSIFLFIFLCHHQKMQTNSKAVNIRQFSAPGNVLMGPQSGPVNMFGPGTGFFGNNGSSGNTSGNNPTGFMSYLNTINQQMANMFTNPMRMEIGMNSGSGNVGPVDMHGTGNNGSGSINSTSGTDPTAFMHYLATINQQLASMVTNPGSMGMNSGSGPGSSNSFGPNTFSSSEFDSTSWSSKFGWSNKDNTTGSSRPSAASAGWIGASSLSDPNNWNGHIKANGSSSTSLNPIRLFRRMPDTGETSNGGAFGSSSTVKGRSIDVFQWITGSRMES